MRNPYSERLRHKRDAEVISAANELTGDLDKTIYWYRNEPIFNSGLASAMAVAMAGKIAFSSLSTVIRLIRYRTFVNG